MLHLDLFSGIGGFALAADRVFDNVQHIFCDNDLFCQAVLRKHWPESVIYGDIRTIATNADGTRLEGTDTKGARRLTGLTERIGLLTGGFPCQPFSAAGARLGTADERHLWPEMYRVIQLTKPAWVIAENVRGLLTWNDGMVFEQVCADLEAAGYEVQPLIIPAVAVNAPHRRDRIWFVAHATGGTGRRGTAGTDSRLATVPGVQKRHQMGKPAEPDQIWNRPWPEAAAEFCSVDDGLPGRLGNFTVTRAAHRKAQLKAYGNAIVPQVAMQIMEAIKYANN